jgi:hypothetical protein
MENRMSLPDPTTPLGYALLLLRGRVDRARRADDAGVSTIEWVVITAMLVLIAGAVYVVISNVILGKAAEIDTNIPAPAGP